MIIYSANYYPCMYESIPGVLSFHKTKRGVLRSCVNHRRNDINEFIGDGHIDGTKKDHLKLYKEIMGGASYYRVEELELFD